MTLGLVHTTESDPGTFAGNYFWFTVSHPEYAPNTLIDPSTKERIRFLPAGVPSKALRNLAGGVETNNRPGGVHQVEIVARAADVGGYSDEWYANLRELLEEESAYAGVAYVFDRSTVRMTFEEWYAPRVGWVGHVRVPENDHWDPGTLDYDRLEAFVITPEDAAIIAKAVWQHPLPAINDDLATTSPHPAGSVLSWDHQEGKISRIRGVKTAGSDGFTLQTVPDELLLAEVARRFRI